MDTSVYMSGLVNLGAPHSAFFEQLGLPSPKVKPLCSCGRSCRTPMERSR